MTKTELSLPFVVLAMDGGAASGKSSTATLLAQQFDFLHVDTGTHYRSVARACLDAGLQPIETSELLAFLRTMKLTTVISGNRSLLAINDCEPFANTLIRSSGVNSHVSEFAAIPAVREAVKRFQRDQVDIARREGFRGIVMEGRDIGTVILPHADLKVFLYADVQTREERRFNEGGSDTIAARDRLDSSRQTAPLRAAEDAIHIDNSGLSLQDVVERVGHLIRNICPANSS
jgi:cytidylate kinase